LLQSGTCFSKNKAERWDPALEEVSDFVLIKSVSVYQSIVYKAAWQAKAAAKAD
jgi:hypothetical protein